MAKQLKKIFDPSVDEVVQTFRINSWHVSQSVDALTAADDYDITISGSFTVTGSVGWNGAENANGITVDTVVRDPSTGELYITSSVGSSLDSLLPVGGGCTKYDIVVSTDTGSIPSSGQAVFVSGSVYGDNDTYGAIRIHEEDANGDNVNNFLGTTFGSKQFNIHWASSSLITTEANSSSQRFNQSITIVTDISCSTYPNPGGPSDPGSVTPPAYTSPSSSGVGPISMVYAETLQGLKTGGTAVSLVDIYLDPLFVYADLSDTGSSAVFQTTVFRRDNLAFVTEYTSESIMAYANTYLNSSQFSFDPSIYDGTQTPYLYRTASMSSEAPEGYYIFASEYTDANLLKNVAKYEGSGVFDSKFPGFDYTPPAPIPPANPSTITKCTVTTQTLAVSKSGDYWEIPWELDAYSGSYTPTSFSSSYICFDADGSYSSLGGAGGSGGSGGSGGGTETLTALGYNDDSKLLAYVDEELAINIRDLNSAGNLDFKLNGGSTINEASILNLIEGDNVSITLSQSPSGTAAYTINADAIDTGSFYISSSVNLNTITFTQGDGTTESVTVDTGSFSIDTGSFYLSSSVNLNTITFTQGDGTTESVTVDTGSAVIIDTGSFYLSSSVNLNTITFTQGDGTTESVTVDTGSAVTIDTGSFYLSSSVNLNTITFTQGDGTTESVTVDTGSSATTDTGSFYLSSSVAGNVITFTQGDGTTESVTVDTGSSATIDTGSFYLSSSISGNTITFNQGDGTTESVTITNSSVITGSYTGSTLTNTIASINWTGSGVNASAVGDDLTIYIPGGSAIDTGSLLTTASISDATITFTKGDNSTFNIEVNNVTSSISASYAFNATSASYAPNLYNTDGTLTDARVVTSNGNNLTFDMTTANFVINSDPSQSVIINDLPTGDNPQVLGVDVNGVIKAMNTSSIAGGGGGGTPDTPLNSFQFNSASAFGGSEMYYDEATQRVGINIDTPQGTLHVRGANNGTGSVLLETDSSGASEEAFAALYFRVADNDGTSYKKFAVIAENTGTDFGVGKLHLALNSDAGGIGNATIADSKLTIDHTGSVFMPDIDTASQAYIIGYNSASGELTYFSTASFGGGGSIDTGSLLTTASISDATITFTKGDNSTFNIEVNNVTSSISASYAFNATSASYAPNIYNTSGILTGNRTLDFATNNLTFDVLNGETFQTVLDTEATHSIIVNEGMIQIGSGPGFSELDSPHILTYNTSSGRVQYMSTASLGGSSTPGGTDTQVQYNNGGSFGGSSIRFDDVNNSVGINVTPYSNRVFAVSSSAGIAMRLQSEQATANRIQFFNSSSVGAGVIAGTINGDDFHLQQTDTTLQENLYVSASGETFLPRISNLDQQHLSVYDTSSGELTYITASEYKKNIYTADGTITGDRTVTFTGGNLKITGSVGYFEVTSNEILFPLVPPLGGNTADVCMINGGGNGRLYYTSSEHLVNTTISSSTGDTQVLFNDGGVIAGESTFTYDKSNNTLEVIGAHAQPGLRLSNNLNVPFGGVTLAEIEAFQGSDQAGAIKFIADSTVGSGDVPTRLEFQVTPDNSGTAQTRMTIKNDGKVGIGTGNPNNGFFEVSGNVTGTSIYASHNIVAYSDARSKTNVDTIEGALDKVNAIRGVTYNKVEDPDGLRYMGVIAQELQPVIPEVVAEGEDGHLGVAYGNITGVLIEAVKELTAKVESLEQEIKDLKA